MAEKVTTMVLKADLQCPRCRKKVKKVLCKFPEIRNQQYDEKQNMVTITVISCCPEKIRDKLCWKGGKTIKSIEIKVAEKPKPPAQVPEKKGVTFKEPVVEKPKPTAEKPAEKPKTDPPKQPAPAPKPEQPAPKAQEPVYVPVPVTAYPVGVSRGPYYEGHYGGPYYEGHYGGSYHDGFGTPPPPPPGYDNYGRPGHLSGCDYYIAEENPSACTIM